MAADGNLWKVFYNIHLDKPFANHGVPAEMAEEAFIVPGQGLEGHELSAA